MKECMALDMALLLPLHQLNTDMIMNYEKREMLNLSLLHLGLLMKECMALDMALLLPLHQLNTDISTKIDVKEEVFQSLLLLLLLFISTVKNSKKKRKLDPLHHPSSPLL